MPVYERGYTNWEPSGRRAWPAWWVITKRGIAEPLKKKRLLFLLMAMWVPAIVKGVIIYFKLKAGDLVDLLGGGWSSVDPAGFLTFIGWQHLAVFILFALIGSGLISSDRRDNGLSLYFSRPLNLVSYVGGKTGIILFYYFLVTLFPVYVLCLFAWLIAPDVTGMELLLFTPLRTTLFCVVTGVSMSMVLLAFSAMAKRSIFVMVWWTVLVFGTKAIAAIATALGKTWLEAINFFAQYDNAGTLIFSDSPKLEISPWTSLLVIAVWTVLAIWTLRRMIRPVEVVS